MDGKRCKLRQNADFCTGGLAVAALTSSHGRVTGLGCLHRMKGGDEIGDEPCWDPEGGSRITLFAGKKARGSLDAVAVALMDTYPLSPFLVSVSVSGMRANLLLCCPTLVPSTRNTKGKKISQQMNNFSLKIKSLTARRRCHCQ